MGRLKGGGERRYVWDGPGEFRLFPGLKDGVTIRACPTGFGSVSCVHRLRGGSLRGPSMQSYRNINILYEVMSC